MTRRSSSVCELCGAPTRGFTNCSALCYHELLRLAQLAAWRRAGETPPASLLARRPPPQVRWLKAAGMCAARGKHADARRLRRQAHTMRQLGEQLALFASEAA